jgi:hypothetical protein
MIPFAPDFTLGYDLKYTYSGTISSDTTTNGTGVDCQIYEGPVHAFVVIGNYGDASTTLTIKLQESTDNSSFTDITGATTSYSASASANDNSAAMIRADNWQKRYVRAALVTAGGGTPSVPVAVAIFAKKKIGGGSGVKTDG